MDLYFYMVQEEHRDVYSEKSILLSHSMSGYFFLLSHFIFQESARTVSELIG